MRQPAGLDAGAGTQGGPCEEGHRQGRAGEEGCSEEGCGEIAGRQEGGRCREGACRGEKPRNREGPSPRKERGEEGRLCEEDGGPGDCEDNGKAYADRKQDDVHARLSSNGMTASALRLDLNSDT